MVHFLRCMPYLHLSSSASVTIRKAGSNVEMSPCYQLVEVQSWNICELYFPHKNCPMLMFPSYPCLPPPSPVFASVNARKVSHCSVPAWVQPTSGWRSGKLRIIKYTQCGRNKQSKRKKRNANCCSDLSQTLISMIKSILAIVDLSPPCNAHD